MNVTVKACLVVNNTTVIGPFDKIDVLPHSFRVWQDDVCGICSADSGEEILEIEWDFIDDCGKFYRPWKGSYCGIYDLNGNIILPCDWRHVNVKVDCFIAVDANNRNHLFDLNGKPLD